MAEDIRWRRKTEVTGSPSGEKLMWKGTGCVVGNEQTLGRRESHTDQGGEVNR
jgi:hypothetical protein